MNTVPTSASETSAARVGIKSVKKAVSILETLASGPEIPKGVRELATSIDMPKSTVQRLLETLEDCGLVEQDKLNTGYRLAPRMFHLGRAVLHELDVRTIALPYMHELRTLSGETVGLNIRVGDDQRMLVEQLESPSPIKFKAEVGELYPIVVGAPGKILLSTLADADIARLASNADNAGISEKDPSNLLDEVRRVRSDGYALAFEETIPELNTIAVAIHDSSGAIAASLGTSGPTSRFSRDSIEKIIPDISAIAERVSEDLGHVKH